MGSSAADLESVQSQPVHGRAHSGLELGGSRQADLSRGRPGRCSRNRRQSCRWSLQACGGNPTIVDCTIVYSCLVRKCRLTSVVCRCSGEAIELAAPLTWAWPGGVGHEDQQRRRDQGGGGGAGGQGWHFLRSAASRYPTQRLRKPRTASLACRQCLVMWRVGLTRMMAMMDMRPRDLGMGPDRAGLIVMCRCRAANGGGRTQRRGRSPCRSVLD